MRRAASAPVSGEQHVPPMEISRGAEMRDLAVGSVVLDPCGDAWVKKGGDFWVRAVVVCNRRSEGLLDEFSYVSLIWEPEPSPTKGDGRGA